MHSRGASKWLPIRRGAKLIFVLFWAENDEIFACVRCRFCIQPPCGQINPVNNLVFGVLRSIYQHLQTLLPPDETIHMGGDEVSRVVRVLMYRKWLKMIGIGT